MADRFKYASVEAIVIGPALVDASQLPENLSIIMDDINDSLSPYHDKYDLVHSRWMTPGIMDMESYIEDLKRCLTPHGSLIMVESTNELVKTDQVSQIPIAKLGTDDPELDAVEGGSYTARVFHGM